MIAVVLQFAHGVADVLEREMGALLGDALGDTRGPTAREFLHGADIEIAVVEERLERRHQTRHETPVLADAVSAHGRRPFDDMPRQELERRGFGGGERHPALAHPREQTRAAVLALVPGVHARKRGLVLVDREHRPLGDETQRGVGDEGRDLDDRVGLRLQTGHLEIDPDEGIATRQGFRHGLHRCRRPRSLAVPVVDESSRG